MLYYFLIGIALCLFRMAGALVLCRFEGLRPAMHALSQTQSTSHYLLAIILWPLEMAVILIKLCQIVKLKVAA